MNCKKTVLWWLVNGDKHRLLNEDEMRINALMPMIQALFPGINYFSVSGFGQVMKECAIPVLKKRFPELLVVAEEKVTAEETVEVSEFLPVKGYEWQDSQEWRALFEELLAA